MLVTDNVYEAPATADGLESRPVHVLASEVLQSPVLVPESVGNVSQKLMKSTRGNHCELNGGMRHFGSNGTERGANCPGSTAQRFFIGDLDDRDDDGELEIGVFDIS